MIIRHPYRNSTFVFIWGEQNGAIVSNRWNYSFGNGNEHNGNNINDWGLVMPLDWKLHSMTIGMRLTNTAATSVRLTVNGTDTSNIITVPGSQTKGVQQFSYSGVAGDTVNFRTVVPGGGNDVVVSALVELFLND